MIEDVATFRRLWMSGNPMLRHRLTHDEASPEVWRAVVASLPEARAVVARNKTLPADILVVLADDGDRLVREEVAGRHGLPRAAQERLAADPESLVRHRLAFNASVDDEILARLARDGEEVVREAAALRVRSRGGRDD